MDLDPRNLKKKDHIFMDFFSMYGQSFIDAKKQDQGKKQPNSVPLKSGKETPLNEFYK